MGRDGREHRWNGVGRVQESRTHQEDPATRKDKPVHFVQIVLQVEGKQGAE